MSELFKYRKTLLEYHHLAYQRLSAVQEQLLSIDASLKDESGFYLDSEDDQSPVEALYQEEEQLGIWLKDCEAVIEKVQEKIDQVKQIDSLRIDCEKLKLRYNRDFDPLSKPEQAPFHRGNRRSRNTQSKR